MKILKLICSVIIGMVILTGTATSQTSEQCSASSKSLRSASIYPIPGTSGLCLKSRADILKSHSVELSRLVRPQMTSTVILSPGKRLSYATILNRLPPGSRTTLIKGASGNLLLKRVTSGCNVSTNGLIVLGRYSNVYRK